MGCVKCPVPTYVPLSNVTEGKIQEVCRSRRARKKKKCVRADHKGLNVTILVLWF